MSLWRGVSRRSVKHLVDEAIGGAASIQSRKLCTTSTGSLYSSSTVSALRKHVAEVQMKRESIRNHIYTLERARRKFSTSCALSHGHIDPPKPGEELHVTFIDKDGDRHSFEVAKGDNLLDIAQANDIEMEGACGGSCACSTCHVIVQDPDIYDKIPEPDDDENDMLDLAFGLTETSRLGCQVKMSPEIEGIEVKLPSMTRNMQASDFEKKS